VLILYNSNNLAFRIKQIAKSKNIKTGNMLKECGLSKNALSTMQHRGSWILANRLATIADYLDVSVDYLLGRTDNPEINK
jgi:transcriptional regulator with XRE-family HTH domain